MDDTRHELEDELMALQPRRPSQELTARLERALADPDMPCRVTASRPNTWKRWSGWRPVALAALATAAVITGILILRPARPAADPGTTPLVVEDPAPQPVAGEPAARRVRYHPVAATNVLYDLKDEGLIAVEGEVPARRLRYRYLDTYLWKDPSGKASLKWSVPRDEIRVLPASLN